MSRGQTTLDFGIGVSIFIIVVVFVLTFVPGMVQPFESSTQEATAASDRLAGQLAGDFFVTDVGEPYVLDKGCVATFFALENSDGTDNDDVDAYPDNDGKDGDPSTEVRDDMFDIKGSDLYESGCGFAVSNGVFSRLAVDSSTLEVRVSIRADLDGDGTAGLLCLDANDPDLSDPDFPDRTDTVVETDDPYSAGDCELTGGDHDVLFATGNEHPTDRSSVVSARRVVSIEGGLADDTTTASLVVEVW